MDKFSTSHALLAALVVACTVAAAAEPKAGRPPKNPAPQAAGESLCLAQAQVEQKVAVVPEGWEARQSDARPQLAKVTFYHGPPAERAALKYDTEEKTKRDWVATWNLAPGARGHWIECAYDHTTVLLVRQLPAHVRTCSVTYERKLRNDAGVPAIKHVSCN